MIGPGRLPGGQRRAAGGLHSRTKAWPTSSDTPLPGISIGPPAGQLALSLLFRQEE
jgi:hypothetical protein